MLGDSHMAIGKWEILSPSAEFFNQGVSGDGFRNILERLDRTIELRPDIIFLEVGVNDLGDFRNPKEIVLGHKAIWRKLKKELPGVKIVVCSLLPMNEGTYGIDLTGINAKIRKTNEMLSAEAKKANIDFIDLYGPLSDSDQQLRQEWTKDGLHLKTEGYDVWRAVLAPYFP
jgi:lysophospholipase L1-like esterase